MTVAARSRFQSRMQVTGTRTNPQENHFNVSQSHLLSDGSAVKETSGTVFFPVSVHRYTYLGNEFTAGSIPGRGTAVFYGVNPKDNKKLLALKVAWQDLARVTEQDAVMKHLRDQGPYPYSNVTKTRKVGGNGKTCTTVGAIRGFLDDQIGTLNVPVENRVLAISISELKRPVKYFWGVHDFVRGLRGALLGHEYLTKIGILHRDISENNIVLGLRPEGERGYLIDLDTAILQKAEEPTQPKPVQPLISRRSIQKSSTHPQHDSEKPMKVLRTGTFPFLSYNVLWDGKHTHFDDVESFLYVLLLFFFSYAGPLSVSELRKADEAGFVQSIGSGRPPHMRNWPKKYAGWTAGEATEIADQKYAAIFSVNGVTRIIESAEFTDCLRNNWPKQLHDPICELVVDSFTLFRNSALRTAATVSRTEVSHTEFISMLDQWLDLYAGLEDKFSNCPFKQAVYET